MVAVPPPYMSPSLSKKIYEESLASKLKDPNGDRRAARSSLPPSLSDLNRRGRAAYWSERRRGASEAEAMKAVRQTLPRR